MRGPRQDTGTSDHIQECQRDLELDFLNFVSEALNAGWGHSQVCLALMNLADNQVLAQAVGMRANEELLQFLASRPKISDVRPQRATDTGERLGR
jgi:hypothetical protein